MRRSAKSQTGDDDDEQEEWRRSHLSGRRRANIPKMYGLQLPQIPGSISTPCMYCSNDLRRFSKKSLPSVYPFNPQDLGGRGGSLASRGVSRRQLRRAAFMLVKCENR